MGLFKTELYIQSFYSNFIYLLRKEKENKQKRKEKKEKKGGGEHINHKRKKAFRKRVPLTLSLPLAHHMTSKEVCFPSEYLMSHDIPLELSLSVHSCVDLTSLDARFWLAKPHFGTPSQGFRTAVQTLWRGKG